MPHIEQQYLRMLTFEGFYEEVRIRYLDSDNWEDAYNAAERKFEGAFGRRRYSDFSTFRTLMYRHINRLRDMT